MPDEAPKSAPSSACHARLTERLRTPRVTRMRAWINGDLLADPTAAGDRGHRPRLHRRRRCLRGGQGRRRRALRADPAPRPARAVRGRPRAARRPTTTPYDGASRPCSTAQRPAARPAADHLHRRAARRWGRDAADGPPTLVVADSAIDAAARRRPRSRPSRGPRNENGATAGLKTTSYAENVDRAGARRTSTAATEAIFANTAGHLCEGTGSNVFYVVDGELRTPDAWRRGCLAGVTRALVLEWCGGTRGRRAARGRRARPSEAFLVSTTRDVQADRPLGRPRPARARARSRSVCRHVGRPRG